MLLHDSPAAPSITARACSCNVPFLSHVHSVPGTKTFSSPRLLHLRGPAVCLCSGAGIRASCMHIWSSVPNKKSEMLKLSEMNSFASIKDHKSRY